MSQFMGFVAHGEIVGRHLNETAILYEEKFGASVKGLAKELRNLFPHRIDELDSLRAAQPSTYEEMLEVSDLLKTLAARVERIEHTS
jgi:hypothetical protein